MKNIRNKKLAYPTKSEISRALQAATQLGIPVSSFEVGPKGVIRVFLKTEQDAPTEAFDQWLASEAERDAG